MDALESSRTIFFFLGYANDSQLTTVFVSDGLLSVIFFLITFFHLAVIFGVGQLDRQHNRCVNYNSVMSVRFVLTDAVFERFRP